MRRPARRWLTADRSLPCDLLHFASKIPLARAEMSLELGEVARLRVAAASRISWATLFLKAYGIVCERHDWLRQSYMAWPLAHVCQHEHSVAMVAIQREHAGRPRLCWGRWIDPGEQSLIDLQRQLDEYCQQPVEEVFRKQLLVSRLPRPLRRVGWWVALNVSGRVRQRQVGTFSMSSLAGQGVNNRDHPTICSTSLTYGPLDRDGHCLATLVYDHRLIDGMQAARALQELSECLRQPIAAELHGLARRAA
jgi:hypothetical protein